MIFRSKRKMVLKTQEHSLDQNKKKEKIINFAHLQKKKKKNATTLEKMLHHLPATPPEEQNTKNEKDHTTRGN